MVFGPVALILLWGGAFALALLGRRLSAALAGMNFILLVFLALLAECFALVLFGALQR